MKRLTQIFQALLGVVALILTALIAAGRLAWRTIRNWWKNRSKWVRCVIVLDSYNCEVCGTYRLCHLR